jgi:hypothetical protein
MLNFYPIVTQVKQCGRFRVILVILWKQYSGRKIFGFFPMLSARFLQESTGSWQESVGKNPDNFRPEYCFYVLAISSIFLLDTVTFPHLSWRISRDPLAGIIDLGSIVVCRQHFKCNILLFFYNYFRFDRSSR